MLRKYQQDCLDAVTNAYDSGTTRQLATLATGTGKTVIFSNLYDQLKSRLPGQMWVIAHREELIDQAVSKLREWNPSLLVDKEMAQHYANPVADVIVSSVASIGRKDTKRADRFDWENVDKVVIDEAHHSTASTYMNFLELTGVLRPDSRKLLLGVTATPKRGDGKALAEVYQKIVYTYAMRNAIQDGWLVDPRGYRVSTATSLDDVKTTAGDFQQDQLANTVNNAARNQLIVKAWQDKAGDRQTVIFTVDIQHAQDLAMMFRNYGIAAEAIWGDDPERAEKLIQHKAKDIQILCNCGVLTEGYDDWRIGCVIPARPTKSSTLYTQMVGRGTRLQDGTGNLIEALNSGMALEKTDCIVIDICDNSRRHSLQTVPSLMGLDDALDLNGKSAVKAVQEIEAAQEQYPHLDFTKLRDITQLKAFIESVNLFDISVPPEIEAVSAQLTWHATTDGGFTLILPSVVEPTGRYTNKHHRQHLKIKENLLGKFEFSGNLVVKRDNGYNVTPFKGERPSLEEAIKAAESTLQKVAPENIGVLKREAQWHSGNATGPQKSLMRKLYRGEVFPFCVCKAEPSEKVCPKCGMKNDLSQGRASKLISARIAGKMVAA